MANTTFSGPILAGTIKNTTGTTVGTDMKNIGQVVMAQTFAIDLSGGAIAAQASNVIIPANSQIVRIDVNVETAFNDSGTDILEVGSSADTDLYVNDVSIAAVGKIALGTAALCANWKDIGTSDQRINFTNSAATNAGEVRITITYQQNNNLA